MAVIYAFIIVIIIINKTKVTYCPAY